MSRLFQVYEDDLRTLETALPRLQDALRERACDPAVQVALQEVKDILSNIRWNYGPPQEMQRVDVEKP